MLYCFALYIARLVPRHLSSTRHGPRRQWVLARPSLSLSFPEPGSHAPSPARGSPSNPDHHGPAAPAARARARGRNSTTGHSTGPDTSNNVLAWPGGLRAPPGQCNWRAGPRPGRAGPGRAAAAAGPWWSGFDGGPRAGLGALLPGPGKLGLRLRVGRARTNWRLGPGRVLLK